VVHIYDSPWPAATSSGPKIGPSQVYDLLKGNGYDPSAPQNSACKASLDKWGKNLTWGYLQYVYSKPIAVAKLVQTPQGLYLGIGNGTLYVVYKKEYFTPTGATTAS